MISLSYIILLFYLMLFNLAWMLFSSKKTTRWGCLCRDGSGPENLLQLHRFISSLRLSQWGMQNIKSFCDLFFVSQLSHIWNISLPPDLWFPESFSPSFPNHFSYFQIFYFTVTVITGLSLSWSPHPLKSEPTLSLTYSVFALLNLVLLSISPQLISVLMGGSIFLDISENHSTIWSSYVKWLRCCLFVCFVITYEYSLRENSPALLNALGLSQSGFYLKLIFFHLGFYFFFSFWQL